MRPDILNYLFSPITILDGIGIRTAKTYEKLLSVKKVDDKDVEQKLPKIVDLIYHKPEKFIHRKQFPNLIEAQNGEIITVKVKIEEHIIPFKYNHPYRIRCYNPTGFISIIYFKLYKDFIEKKFPIGEEIIVSGRVDRFNGELQMSHPDYIYNVSDKNIVIPEYESVYPLTAGLNNKAIRHDINEAISKLPSLSEWIDKTILQNEGWLSWKESILAIHQTNKIEDLDLNGKYIRRLAFDELLANQIAMSLVREKIKNNKEKHLLKRFSNGLKEKFLAKLSFQLTRDQIKVLNEIDRDIYSEKTMLRLLQGDTGSGKTVVAFLSALPFVENKKQTVIMVPTSILAQQHYDWISVLCEGTNVRVELLTGKIKGKKREEVLKKLENGEIDILVGTHAVFQKHVKFKDLGYAVIDEQHRFGVAQRLALAKKGKQPDTLVMTATPIPRTLTLTIYGDMEVSYIREKPKNRKEINTRVISKYKMSTLLESLKKKIKEGEKIFWICPLVDESEVINASAVNERYQEFKKIFGNNLIGFIHGKMKEDEKDEIMKQFNDKDGKTKLLIATTVIEVGIDVPDATIMVIEHPERFGLSQLHQLRGRVGRGSKTSYCILLYDNISDNSVKRLKIIKNTTDGFIIAEEDLKMRGAGEILGTKQSGYQNYKIANLSFHYDLLCKASQLAKIILNKKDRLDKKELENITTLLYLFQYENYLKIANFC
jgi:ATP-dependent DNA helicase RecG